MGLKCNHFAGWLTQRAMMEHNWFRIWFTGVSHAELENKTMIVFKVPKEGSEDIIREIETMLQEKLKTNG